MAKKSDKKTNIINLQDILSPQEDTAMVFEVDAVNDPAACWHEAIRGFKEYIMQDLEPQDQADGLDSIAINYTRLADYYRGTAPEKAAQYYRITIKHYKKVLELATVESGLYKNALYHKAFCTQRLGECLRDA